MSTPPTRTPGPGRDSLPPKKRDPRLGFSEEPAEVIFKVPFPYKSQNEERSYHVSHPDLHQPIHVPTPKLYQPWTQSHTTTRAKPYLPSPVRDNHGCAEWAEHYHRGLAAIHSAWDVPLIPNHHRDVYPPSPHPTIHSTEGTHHPSKFRPVILSTENPYVMGGGHRWQSPTVKAPFSPHARRQSSGRHRAPYRKGKQGDQSQSSTVALSTGTSSLANKNHHRDLVYTHHNIAAKYPTTDKYWTLEVRENTGGSPPHSSPHHSNSTPSDHPPWLLPHFAAGSLIELRNGRLRRVEDLQMEDFLISAEACPELHLSCCTVQNISPSASPSLSRLLILLHDKCSQVS